MIEKHIPVQTLKVPIITDKVDPSKQALHLYSEVEELKVEMLHGKYFAALLEAGDVLCSAMRTMDTLIKTEGFNCSVQDILDMIAQKNDYRNYYDGDTDDKH